MIVLLTILASLLLLSAFFSAAETSFIAISEESLYRMKLSNKTTGYLQKLFNKKSKVMSAALLANNVINTMASSIATLLFMSVFNDGQ